MSETPRSRKLFIESDHMDIVVNKPEESLDFYRRVLIDQVDRARESFAKEMNDKAWRDLLKENEDFKREYEAELITNEEWDRRTQETLAEDLHEY